VVKSRGNVFRRISSRPRADADAEDVTETEQRMEYVILPISGIHFGIGIVEVNYRVHSTLEYTLLCFSILPDALQWRPLLPSMAEVYVMLFLIMIT
jgi:hypothetical protein